MGGHVTLATTKGSSEPPNSPLFQLHLLIVRFLRPRCFGATCQAQMHRILSPAPCTLKLSFIVHSFPIPETRSNTHQLFPWRPGTEKLCIRRFQYSLSPILYMAQFVPKQKLSTRPSQHDMRRHQRNPNDCYGRCSS